MPVCHFRSQESAFRREKFVRSDFFPLKRKNRLSRSIGQIGRICRGVSGIRLKGGWTLEHARVKIARILSAIAEYWSRMPSVRWPYLYRVRSFIAKLGVLLVGTTYLQYKNTTLASSVVLFLTNFRLLSVYDDHAYCLSLGLTTKNKWSDWGLIRLLVSYRLWLFIGYLLVLSGYMLAKTVDLHNTFDFKIGPHLHLHDTTLAARSVLHTLLTMVFYPPPPLPYCRYCTPPPFPHHREVSWLPTCLISITNG